MQNKITDRSITIQPKTGKLRGSMHQFHTVARTRKDSSPQIRNTIVAISCIMVIEVASEQNTT
jgi:hypothetical protein